MEHQAAHTPKVGIDNEFVPNIHYWGFSVFRISFCLWIMLVGSTKHAGCQWQTKSVMIHDSITSSPKQTKRRIESNGFQIFCRILSCNLTLLTSGPYGFTAILKLSFSLMSTWILVKENGFLDFDGVLQWKELCSSIFYFLLSSCATAVPCSFWAHLVMLPRWFAIAKPHRM